MKPSLTVIVVAHNRPEYTFKTIDSLQKTVPQADIFVYVQGVSDETAIIWDVLGRRDPEHLHLHHSSENEGWATAVNKSMKIIKPETDFILLSNNDVEYHDGWYEKLISLYEKYPRVGIMGVWKHIDHGISHDHGDLLEKDDMPAVGWLMKRSVLEEVGPIAEKGPCHTKGGNGEDSDYVALVRSKGFLIGAPLLDVAQHFDGY